MKTQTVLTKGASVMLQNIVKKQGDADFWVVSTTTTIHWSAIDVPHSILDQVTHREQNNNCPVSPSAALDSSSSSIIMAKVVQV